MSGFIVAIVLYYNAPMPGCSRPAVTLVFRRFTPTNGAGLMKGRGSSSAARRQVQVVYEV